MKKEPQPLAELSVSVLTGTLLILTPASEDAKLFIEQSKKYGRLTYFPDDKQYWLSVSNLYDVTEVKKYLESYNE